MLYSENEFTKKNLDMYLKEVSKIYKKKCRNTPAELTLIGGAAVLANYGFRDMTTDIDAIINASSVMKEAILEVADKYELTDDWLNFDFRRTDSYSSKLIAHSKHYKTFYNNVEIRIIEAEYLVAMKVVSGRTYKHDLSDIVGIINEERKRGNYLGFDDIDNAMKELYGDWDKVDKNTIAYLKDILAADNLESRFLDIQEKEKEEKLRKIAEWNADSAKEEKKINYSANSDEIIKLINRKIKS